MVITRRQIEIESIFLLAIAAGVGLFFVLYSNDFKSQFNVVLNTPVAPITADASVSRVSVSSQISPDGEKLAIMKVTENPDNTATYEFSTADEDGANELLVFTKILDSSGSMSIPFNTWSPDDKYFFVQENSGGNKNVFAFKATGESFSDTEKYLDVTDIFLKRETGNNFDEATGWASETLIIINTKKDDGSKGFSYWFEIPSKAIIQLSTEF